MQFRLSNQVEHILVLGAGASVDYGLPVWKDLSLLIKEKVDKDTENRYQYKKEVLAWIDKVGENKDYDTIDKCITEESISEKYHNGDEIENQIFLVIKDIFSEAHKEDAGGWIRILNEHILHDRARGLEHKIAFINYNYDNVLDKNFLNFSYLHPKLQRYNHRERLSALSEIIGLALYPHGSFFTEQDPEDVSHIAKHIETMKSYNEEHLDVVSCYESNTHTVEKSNLVSSLKLHILGLGSGLEINLNNLKFRNPISEIHITIKDTSTKNRVISFLSEKYDIPATEIRVYSTCEELINNYFSN